MVEDLAEQMQAQLQQVVELQTFVFHLIHLQIESLWQLVVAVPNGQAQVYKPDTAVV